MLDNYRTLSPGVAGNLPDRGFQGPADDIDTHLFIAINLQLIQGRQGIDEGGTTAGNDAFLYGGPGSGQGVFDPVLLLLQFRFGGGADFNDSYSAGQLGQTFLEFLPVEVGGGFLDLSPDLVDAGLDLFGVTTAIDDDGFFLVDPHLTGLAQHADIGCIELQADLFRNNGTTGEDGNILQHGLAAVTKARSLHGYGIEGAPQLIENQGCQGFPFHVFGYDQEGLARLDDLFQDGQEVVDGTDLAVCDQDIGFIKDGLHFIGIGHHVVGDIAPVKLHPFHNFQGGADPLGFFHGDDAVFADLFHGIGNELPDLLTVGGNGGNLGDGFPALDGLAVLLDGFNGHFDRLFDTPLHDHGVGSGGNVLESFLDDGLGQQGSGGGTVSCHIIGLGGNFLHQLGSHILKGIFQFDFPGNGYPVVGDGGGTEFFVQNNVPALGPHGNLNGCCQFFYPSFQSPPGFFSI